MGKIYIVMGKSASGKDTIYKEILEKNALDLKTVVGYTTRPIRQGEKEGVEYHFVDVTQFEKLKTEGKVIEARTYHTILGDWHYFTVADGQIDLASHDYIMLNTLEGYLATRQYYGEEKVVPIYIEVEDSLRLERAILREKQQKAPNFAEVCRRFLADEEDFSAENLKNAGIEKKYQNVNLEKCLAEIICDIQN